MNTLNYVIALLLSAGTLCAQSNGFRDDFEDASVDTLWNDSIYTLWKADHPGTFGISEREGYLHIAYSRTAASGQWDNFNFTPPREIDVSELPEISLKVRSTVATSFTIKPIYSNGEHDWLQKDIPSDSSWHIYTFQLVERNYSDGKLSKIYLYFDGGSSELKSGLVQFDDFQVAGFSIAIKNLQARVVDSSRVELSWESSHPALTSHYTLYRSTEMDFYPDMLTKIGETSDTFYLDTGLTNHMTYYYQVMATDTDGMEHLPARVSITTSHPGSVPLILIEAVNSDPVGRYEKFEVSVDLLNADYSNPYNPEELDLYAWFFSPDGDSMRINGFYDNYLGKDHWKIRFAANQAGAWEYQVFAKDLDGTGTNQRKSFLVTESTHKGWLHVSPENPNYFIHDDGSSFYGISVYYPWNVTRGGLDRFAAVSGNFFGYWDCTFDPAGNGGGKYLLESMESGVGRYDQRKAARMDEVLSWAEASDMKVMLAIWVHGYLRIEGVPWSGGRWYSDNPYSKLVDIDAFHTDSLALSYQEKHYRYMIARWGYSQALGIWEIINEMHGTTGWVRNQAASKKWVEDVHAYFKKHDPFQRPTTASFGGSEGASHFKENDQLGDVVNVHFYEQHGWPNPHPDNVVRSGLANMVSETRKLKSKGRRPAFLGEAGYDHMLADHRTEVYSWELHNTFWAGLCNGMASTPFWWEFNSTDVLTTERLQDYQSFATFVSDIDFAQQDFLPADIWVEQTEGYFMGSRLSGFGWMYNFHGQALAQSPIYISDTELNNGNYALDWYHTWTGETLQTDSVLCISGTTWGQVPKELNEQDVALKLTRIPGGNKATQLHVYLVKKDTLIAASVPWKPAKDSTLYQIACYATDDKMRLDTACMGRVEIRMEGEAYPAEPFFLDLVNGGVLFDFKRMGSAAVVLTADMEGLGTGHLHLEGITGTNKDLKDLSKVQLNSYPNPLSLHTTISFMLPAASRVKLSVYNAQGKLVKVLANGHRAAGRHQVVWEADSQAAGLYYCTLSTEYLSGTKRLLITK